MSKHMKYPSGEDIQIGDHVKIGGQDEGVVVAIPGAGIYSKGYTASEWSYLESGTLVSSDKAGLIHYPDHDDQFELISRT